MPVEIKYRLRGDPAYQMALIIQRRALPRLDNIHKQALIQLTATAKANLKGGRVRPWESGQRTHARLTGTLTGEHGHKASITGNILNPGTTTSGSPRQGKGVGWPDLAILDRRARHWRVLEYGTPYVTMPIGVWVDGNAAVPVGARTTGQIYMPYREFIGRAGLSQRTLRSIRGNNRSRARAARAGRLGVTRKSHPRGNLFLRRRGEGWQGKFFLQKAWDEVMGPNGVKMAAKYEKAFREIFGDYRVG